MITDKEVLELHDVGCRSRCRMELKLVNKIIEDAAKAEYTIKIQEYEGEPTPDIKKACFNLDEAFLKFYNKDKECKGWVLLVFGNSGYDLISDYSVILEEFLKGAIELSDRLENGLE